MYRYKGVIFDLDGTLINTDLYVVTNYAHLFYKYKIKDVPSLKTMVYFSGPPLTEVFSKYFPNIDIDILKRDFLEFALKYTNPLSSLYENELEVLTNLKNKGIKLGLVTNKSKSAVEDCLKYFDLAKYFDSIFYLERTSKAKPDPLPILSCIDELALSKDEVIYLGDDKYDIQASKNADIKVILAKFGLKEGLETYKPDFVIKSYLELERIVEYGK